MLLILIATDGVPSDGRVEDFKRLIANKLSNVYISCVECTDVKAEVEHLDEMSKSRVVSGFSNSTDYREFLETVKAKNDPTFKFDFYDYVAHVLLAPPDEKIF